VITVPPPQMVANMRVGNMDGYCVGEPWNHRAIIDGIGVTAATTQDIWKRPPREGRWAPRGEFAKKYPEHLPRRDRWRSWKPAAGSMPSLSNKNKMAETIADKSYVNTSVDAINQRILGATRTAWARPGTTPTT